MDYNITLNENSDFIMEVQLYTESTSSQTLPTGQVITSTQEVPVSLVGSNVRAQLKRNFTDGTPILLTFLTKIVNAQQGIIELKLNRNQLTNLSNASARNFKLGYYDVLVQDNSNITTRVMQGEVFVSKTVTT